QFKVELEDGVGIVHASHAVFQLQELEKRTLRVLYEIAKAGDVFVRVEGGQHQAILTNSRQRQNLPPDWIGADDSTPLAKTPSQLGQLIRGAVDAHESYRRKVVSIYDEQSPQSIDPTPWSTLNPEERVIYLQARRRERCITQTNRSEKYFVGVFVP